jgi:hypothetical protein
MEIWSHAGKLYEVASGYSLPEGAWHYELTGLTGAPGTRPLRVPKTSSVLVSAT